MRFFEASVLYAEHMGGFEYSLTYGTTDLLEALDISVNNVLP